MTRNEFIAEVTMQLFTKDYINLQDLLASEFAETCIRKAAFLAEKIEGMKCAPWENNFSIHAAILPSEKFKLKNSQ